MIECKWINSQDKIIDVRPFSYQTPASLEIIPKTTLHESHWLEWFIHKVKVGEEVFKSYAYISVYLTIQILYSMPAWLMFVQEVQDIAQP